MKKQFLFFVLAFALLVLTSAVRADSWNLTEQPSINSMSIQIEGNEVFAGDCVQVPGLTFWNCNTEQLSTAALERGYDMPVKVVFVPGEDMSNLQIKAWISGYHDDIEAKTSQFDAFEGNVYTKTLTLGLPNDLDALDTYTLHVQITYKNDLSGIESADIDTVVQRTANQIKILNAEVFGTMPVKAGNTIYVDVVVKNIGNHELEDVFARASIKELSISRTAYIGDLVSEDCSSSCDDEEDSQSARIALTIPETATAGTYLLEVEVFGESISDKVVKAIYIEKGQTTTGTTGTAGTGSTTAAGFDLSAYNAKNSVEAGKGTAFSVLVSNPTTSAVTLTLAALGTEEWASSQVNPSVITLAPGESKTATVYIVVKENAISGDHIFTVKATSGANSKTVNLTASVEGSQAVDMKTILMIAGIVLALVIVVLLIVLLTKKQSAKLEETYY